MRKIYFGGSIRGGRDDVGIYGFLINYLKNFGEVLTEHIGDKNLGLEGERDISNKVIHDRDLYWLGDATHLVMEVSNPSLGVGYEIGRIVERNSLLDELGKPILCMYRNNSKNRLSAMISGCGGLDFKIYDDEESAKKIINNFFYPNPELPFRKE